MNLFNGHFLKQCEGLRRAAGNQARHRFLGRRIRRTLAGGTEVTDTGDYSSGDDYRYVDWNRAARLDELVSKQYHGAAREEITLLLDASRSMQLCTPEGLSKFDFARQVAAAVGYLGLANHDRVRAATCAGATRSETPLLSGQRSGAELLKFLEMLGPPEGAESNLATAVEQFLQRRHPQGQVVLISDMLVDGGFVSPLDLLRHYGYQLFVVHVYCRDEADPGASGKATFHDIEADTSASWRLDDEDLQHYREVFEEFCQSIRTYCGRYGCGPGASYG